MSETQTASRPNPTLLTAKEAQEVLRLGRRVIYELAASGELGHYRIRGRLRFAPSDIEQFLRARHIGGRRNHFGERG